MNPEKMVIAEARRTYTYLGLFGYSVDAAVVNRVLPDDDTTGETCTSEALRRSVEFYRSRRQLQLESIETLQTLLPLSRITLPEVDSPNVIESLTTALLENETQ